MAGVQRVGVVALLQAHDCPVAGRCGLVASSPPAPGASMAVRAGLSPGAGGLARRAKFSSTRARASCLLACPPLDCTSLAWVVKQPFRLEVERLL